MGKANAQGKGKGKGKGKAKGNSNPVRDGPPESAPVRELAAGKHGADHWDDLRRAWAGHLSQPQIKGGHHHHQPHHPNQQNHHLHHHPDGRTPTDYDRSDADGGQGRSEKARQRKHRGSGGGGSGSGSHTHTGQKRKATATNGAADDGGECAAKRHKGNSRPSGQGAGAGAGARGVAEPHPDFWHPDGSVIVEVGKTRFKLHQSTLQKHSAYFADAFRGKGGHQGGNRTQLPVYRVDETTAEDFASLLTVIEEPMCVCVSGSFLTISGYCSITQFTDGFLPCGIVESLGSTERSRPRCLCWLASFAPRAPSLSTRNANGPNACSDAPGPRRSTFSRPTRCRTRPRRWLSRAATVCWACRRGPVTSCCGYRRSDRGSPSSRQRRRQEAEAQAQTRARAFCLARIC